MSLQQLLNELLQNMFIPKNDLSSKLPDAPGAYLICAKSIDVLPTKMRNLEYTFINESPVIYVGIAGRETSKVKSLRKRDYRNHFNGTARKSTLRKSLGVLFDFEKEYENEEVNSKYKFIYNHEQQLTQWMKENLTLYFITIDNPREFELYMIEVYAPPLNLKDNNSEKNKDFRKNLSELRTIR